MSTKYKLRITGECKQNMKLCKRRGLPMDELWTVVGKLLNGDLLDAQSSYQQSRDKYVDAYIDYQQNLLKYRQATGQCRETGQD